MFVFSCTHVSHRRYNTDLMMKREEKEEKITDLNFPETKINNILKISIYYKKNVCGHLFLCKELKSLMFWVVEGRGSESGFSVIFKFGRLWLIFSFLSLLSPILIRIPPWTMIIPTYACMSKIIGTSSEVLIFFLVLPIIGSNCRNTRLNYLKPFDWGTMREENICWCFYYDHAESLLPT